MALFPICLFLLIYAWTTSATSNANSISLSSELTNFIPTCAQTCFISFIEANFPTSICSNTPTLDCLCSHNSTSGYTIGEGAVQCILSEDQIGFCNRADALEVVVIDAFTMCNGQDGALPNTHGTITATLVAETASSGIVIIAPQTAHTTTVTTTTTTSSGSSGFSTVTRSSSSSSISTSPSTNSTTTTSSATSTSSSSTALLTSTSSPSQVTPAKSTTPITTNEATPSLTGPQIAGISVGAVGGAAVVAGLLVLCACLRRRRRSRVRDSDMMPFQPEPIEPVESMRYNARGFLGPKEGNRGPGGSANGLAGRVTPPPRPPRLDTGSPNMFSRRSIRPDTIGVAISPETGNMTKEERRSSRLLPEKPVLTLQMPPRAAGRRFSQRPPVSGANRGVSLSRESTGTQFEEDIDSAVIVDDIPTRQELDDGGWRPQRPSDSNPTIPDFPMPGETRAFHGQPANTKSIVPDYYIKPLQLGRGRTPGSFSQPQVPERNPQRQLQQLNNSGQVSRPITGSSSVYSGRPSLPPSEGRQSNPSYNPPPKNRNSYKQTGPYDSWESEPRSAGSEKEPKTAGTELSPVIESPKSPSPRSPSSPSGVSPVSYPKIPKLLSPATIRMVPPPPQPDFSQVFSSRANTVRIVPPEKALLPVRRADTDLKPWRQAEIAAQQARIQNQQNQAKQQEQQSSYQAYQRPRPQPQPQQNDSLAPSARYNYNAPLSSQNQSQTSNRPTTSSSDTLPTLKTPNQDQNFQGQRQPTALEAFNNKQNEKLRTQSTQSRNSSILTTTSIAASSLAPSTTSSLLAKRRGSKQAAALALNNKNNEEEARRNAAKWRVLQEKEIEAAKSPGWRPQLGQAALGSGGASGNGRFADTGNFDSEKEKLKKFERTELPNTPGWVPRLTPTRRGDELFLSVQ